MEFRVLGPLEVVRDGREVPLASGRQRTVLACLLLRAGRLVPVTTLIDRLWGDAPPSDARGTLQVHVLRLRRALDDATVIRTRPDGYLITTAPDDLRRFDALTTQAERAGRDGDQAAALEALRAATSLWRGPILANVASASLHAEEVSQLTERCLRAAERRYELELLLGDHEAAVAELRTLTAANPHREPLHGLLMRALYRSGRQAEALAVYDRVAAVLREDLGLDPGDELRRTRQAILTRTERPALRHEAPWRRLCQLPSPAGDFVGRDGELARIGDLLDGDGPGVPVVTVTGQAGVGKTALAVHAAHALRDRFPDAQLYASLTGRDAADAAADLLRALGVPEADLSGGPQARSAALRARLADRRVLLVLDDAADAAQVEALLPGTRGSAVLVTSRRLLTGLPGNRIVRLGPFTGDEAAALLRRVIGDDRVAAEPEAARRVAAACGHLPLALRIAGARLAALPATRLAAFARRLEDPRRRLDELTLGRLQVRDGLRLSHHALDVPARRALERLGLLGGAEVTGRLLRLLAGPGDEQRALESLVDANLLYPDGTDPAGEPRYRLHALTADFAAELAGSPHTPGNRAALGRVVRALAATAAAATRARSSNDLPADDRTPLPRDDALASGEPVAWFAAHRALLDRAVEQACAAGLVEDAARLVDMAVPLLHRQVAAASLRRLRETVRDAARARGHEPIMWREEYGLGILSLYAAPPGTTAGTLTACAEAFERLGMTRELCYAFSTLTFVRLHSQAAADATLPEPASALAGRAVRLAHGSDDHHAQIVALTARADALAASGHGRDGLTSARTALRVARTLREPHFEATALSRVSWCSLTVGDVDGAAEACTRAMRLLDDLRDRRSAAWLLSESAYIARARGRHAEAIALAERAANQFLELDDRHGHASASAALAAWTR